MQSDGRRRVIIEKVTPEVDAGRFPAKRIVGDRVVVEADVFTDGHDVVRALILYRKAGADKWTEAPMRPLVNDRWRGEFPVTEMGRYEFTIEGWVDQFHSWQRDVRKKMEAGQDVSIDLLAGANLVEAASRRAPSESDRNILQSAAADLRSIAGDSGSVPADGPLSEELADLVERYPDRRLATQHERVLQIVVDRKRARFSSWYELFPRSCAAEPGRHGTFRDVEARLPYVASMGFDVLYFPPIHPIGRSYRKGKNNTLVAGPDDPGSPWAIGAEEGGHKDILPELGTLEDFRRLLAKAREHGLEVALDLAFQCTPDHPYVKEHPEWFRHRPDGTIQYAENPPKKYQDIYPLDFETEQWRDLWDELKSVVRFWIDQGVRIFRVDNPHTKAFPFWEELIQEFKQEYPELILLSEAFTRPKVRYRLAKLGFNQSYTYFAWRNTKYELTQYLTELTQSEIRDYFRPNLWPNTPDILTEYLQHGGRPAFMARLVLAATLGASYGIYGPAFELCENQPREPGSEEYLNSEKYEIRYWELSRPDSLKDLIARVNAIRKENPALHEEWNLRFHNVDNDQLICYSKRTRELDNIILVVVNLDPHHTHSGWVELPLEDFGLDARQPYQVHDLLTDARYLWNGPRNYLELNPSVVPAHIFRLRRRLRTERDFDYYM